MNKSSSPSRTYVAMCNNTNFDGYYFKKFVLPETNVQLWGDGPAPPLENSTRTATFYFLNWIDAVANIEGCMTAEDFANISDCA
jgi:hypothetical protein